MSQETEVSAAASKRDEVMPQVYFVMSLFIGVICGLAAGIFFRMFIVGGNLAIPEVVIVGLLCGVCAGFPFGSFTLNDAVAGGIPGYFLGIGLGLSLNAIVVMFGLFFSLGLMIGLGAGYGLRHLRYREKKVPPPKEEPLPTHSGGAYHE